MARVERMPDEDQLFLRPDDPPWSYRARDGDPLYGLRADLDFIKVQLARLPTRNDVWRAGWECSAGRWPPSP